MTTEEMKANIQNGITWLNENRSEWQDKVRQKIEVGEFDMMKPCNCVIGTTDGNFSNVFPRWGLESEYEPVELGFALPFMDDEDEAEIEYAKLTQLWIEVINDL